MFWTAKDNLEARIHLGPGPASSIGPWDNRTIRSKSQTDLVGKETVTYADSDLCPTKLAQREGLARSQCGQIKTTWQRLTTFPSAVGALNLIQARRVN